VGGAGPRAPVGVRAEGLHLRSLDARPGRHAVHEAHPRAAARPRRQHPGAGRDGLRRPVRGLGRPGRRLQRLPHQAAPPGPALHRGQGARRPRGIAEAEGCLTRSGSPSAGAAVVPRATPPRIRTIALSSDTVRVSPSHSVAMTTLTTGVASRPSDVVTAGRARLAMAVAQYASAVPGTPARPVGTSPRPPLASSPKPAMCSSAIPITTGRSPRGGGARRPATRPMANSATVPIAERKATVHSGGTLARITLLTGHVRPQA